MIKKIKSLIFNMSIFYKIMVPFTIILISAVLIISVFFVRNQSHDLSEMKKNKAASIVSITKSYSHLLETFDYQLLQSNIDSLKKANKDIVYLHISDTEKKLIASTNSELINKEITIPVQHDIIQIKESLISESESEIIGHVFIGITLKDINEHIAHTRNFLILIGLVFLLISIIIYRLITKKVILKPLGEFSSVANSISMGDFPEIKKIETDDEIGRVSVSLKKMVDFLLYIKEQAYEIANGNYNIDIAPRSEKDILGKALFTMKNNLVETREKSKQEDWIKSGLTELNNKIRGEQDISALAQNIIRFLAAYLNAQIGTIYVARENRTLHMTGSYAYTKRKNISSEYGFGEGLVGQAALEKEIILITNVPEDYIKVQSGLGECSPYNIIVVPFLYEGEVKGVIELGSIYEISDIKIEYLKQITTNIAIGFNTAESRIKTNELLKETQKQAQELAAQQEELRQTNEILETQTKELEKSEARLQQQQQELKQSNEELEEQARLLEEQKDDINKKNIELHQTQKMLQQKAEELEINSKYKSQFLANMSHELRTPLNSMLLLSDLLQKNREGNLTEKQREYADSIHHAGTDIFNLINDILDLSKIEAGKMELNIETLNIDNFTSNIERTFKHLIMEKGLNFKITRTEDLPEEITTDRQRLEQIIKNLISNAIKFTSKGEIKVDLFRPDNKINMNESGLDTDKAIAIAVRDTGIGISKEKQKVLFEAFKQLDGSTSRKFGGTGLGLTISRDLANLLGGEIQVSSEINKGSSFIFYLPIAIDKSGKFDIKVNLRDKKTDGSDKSGDNTTLQEDISAQNDKFKISDIRDDRRNIFPKDKTLLIIEDDPHFAKILFDIAQEKGFKGLIAEDGEAGLALADQYRPNAIILDIKLPRIDGWTVMEKLRKNPKTNHIPVHFMSVHDKSSKAMKMGAIGYLTKPVSSENLSKAFKKIEEEISKKIRNLLIVETDQQTKDSIIKSLSSANTISTSVDTGKKALEILKSDNIDCMIIGLNLKDISSFDLIEKIRDDETIPYLPIIVYTSRELSDEENTKLNKYTESVIIKGTRSLERLLDETTLFLYEINNNVPEKREKIAKVLKNSTTILKNKKILLVDDDMRNVFALSSILEDKGLNITIAKNGKESLKCLDHDPLINLVLMDIMMPEMDGYTAMTEIRKQKRFEKLPIIALTAKAMTGERKKCIDAGASDYLAKPIDIDKLLSLLKVWLYE